MDDVKTVLTHLSFYSFKLDKLMFQLSRVIAYKRKKKYKYNKKKTKDEPCLRGDDGGATEVGAEGIGATEKRLQKVGRVHDQAGRGSPPTESAGRQNGGNP